MRKRPVTLGLLAAILLLPSPAPAQGERSGTITLDIQDADVREVINAIAEASGANLVVAPEVTGRVTLHLEEVPWRAALQAVVKSVRCQVIEEDSGILRLMPTARTFLWQTRGQAPSRGFQSPDRYTLIGPRNFLTGYAARNEDGTTNAVIEIPTGTNAKWEVVKGDGVLRWEFENRKPRVVQYLGYPGNYGMIPRTLLPEELGGDGDPLDVVVLGPPVPRGDVVRVRIIGVLELLDGGEQDDKLLAVTSGTPFAEVRDLAQLEESFPGVVSILSTWFANYKGPGQIEVRGSKGAAKAQEILDKAEAAFELAHGK
jgi:inorganic pyrophosphatase